MNKIDLLKRTVRPRNCPTPVEATLFCRGEAEIEIRSHGDPGKPAIVFLPGIHGDWTLVSSFRTIAARHFRFIEMTYPRTRTWSAENYARNALNALERTGVEAGWLLAESFGSQVAWGMLDLLSNDRPEHRFECKGLILAGGFVRYPAPVLLGIARRASRAMPQRAWRALFWLYARYASFRHRSAPETAAAVEEFIARRTPEDIEAIAHRLDLIAGNDPRKIARGMRKPVYLVAGLVDPVVPVVPVKRWLRKNCPGFQGTRVIAPADHNVLGTEPEKALRQIVEWMRLSE